MPRLVPVEEQPRRPRLAPVESAPAETRQSAPRASIPEAVSRAGSEGLLGNASGLANLVLNPQSFGPQSFETRSGLQVEATPGIPLPSGEQMVAGFQTATELPGALLRGESLQLGDRFDSALADQRRSAQERPGATMVGGLLGEGATLATGRAPFARGIAQLESRVAGQRVLDSVEGMAPTGKRTLARAWDSKAFQKLRRAAGRATETGVEGAALAAIQDGDALETGAWAAGAQLGGSAAVGAGQGLVSGGLKGAGLKIGTMAFAVGSLWQLGKSAAPGGNDFFMESLETGFDKTMLGLAGGATVGVLGAGRGRSGKFAEEWPKFVDSLSAVPRGATLSAIRDLSSGDNSEAAAATMDRLRADPNFFGEKTGKRLLRAFENERLDTEIGELLDSDEEFRTRLEAPVPDPAERAQQTIRDAISSDTNNAKLPHSPEVAATIARRIGHKSEIESAKGFISDRLRDERRSAETLGKLPKRSRNDALELNLAGLLSSATRKDGDRSIIDPERFQTAWAKLPSATRESYSKPQREAIEGFMDAASTTRLSVVPQLAARSLMLPNGKLSRRLRGQTNGDDE